MKNKAFTLAETLIVIGIIGVVAALTLPNLNHATGDKETITRLMKAYSMLNEANDRAVAIYGPISTWKSNEQCENDFPICWMNRVGEFLKISKSCNDSQDISCDSLSKGDFNYDDMIYQLSDGMTVGGPYDFYTNCDYSFNDFNDICIEGFHVDINGPNKGKNKVGIDIFQLSFSDSNGITTPKDDGDIEVEVSNCMSNKNDFECTWWVFEYGNLDYLKADNSGKCNDSNIILDGVNNTSCH